LKKKSQCCEEFSVDHQKRKDAFFLKKAMYEYCLAVITVAYVENRSEKKIEILYLIVMEKLGEALNYKYFEPLEIMKFLYNMKTILKQYNCTKRYRR